MAPLTNNWRKWSKFTNEEGTMTDEEKNKLVAEVMEGFDFEKVHSIMYLTRKAFHIMLTVEQLKDQAEKYLLMALEHQDREFWWAGGMNGHGGLCACYDNKWGLSLNYIAVAKKVRIQKDKEL
jgi:hypothetical protein